ncbi:MAG: hypothetical protein AAF487_01230 [Bacteroidota bacterium]
MTKTELLEYIKNPQVLRAKQSEELKSLLEQYPYSPTLAMLFLKSLKNEKDISFDEVLKKTASIIPDRNVLYAFLKEEQSESRTVQNSEARENAQPNLKAEQLPDTTLQDEIRTEIVSNHFSLDVSDELPSIEELMPKSKKKKKVKHPKKTAHEKKSNLDFLSFLQGDISSEDNTEPDRLAEFIAKKEKALKGKKAIVSTEKMAEKSLLENENLITETLAEIFVKQKKYGKAIKAFKKLSLKYPEKSLYFAARLKKVKKLKSKNKK